MLEGLCSEGRSKGMRAQIPRTGTSKGSPTKCMAENRHPSDVRAEKAPSVGGISEWLRVRGTKEPVSPSATLSDGQRGTVLWRGAQSCLVRLHPFPSLVPPQRPRETPEPSQANMLGADLRRPRRRLSTGPGLGWTEPEPLDTGVPLPPRPTTLPLLIPPRISITKADRREEDQAGRQGGGTGPAGLSPATSHQPFPGLPAPGSLCFAKLAETSLGPWWVRL